MKVRDVMTPDPVAIHSDRAIREALDMLSKHHIRHLPILGDDGRLCGILSDRSVAPWRQTLMDAESWHDVDLGALLLETKVADIVERQVITVEPDDGVEVAIDRLLDHNIGAVPVIDERDELVGIVSYVDLLRAMKQMMGK